MHFPGQPVGSQPLEPPHMVGDFLVGRTAMLGHDYLKAQDTFVRLIEDNPDDELLRGLALLVHVAVGDTGRSVEIATRMGEAGIHTFLSDSVLMINDFLEQRFDEINDRMDISAGAAGVDYASIIPQHPFGEILHAWASLGLGNVAGSTRHRNDVISGKVEVSGFTFHHAMVLAATGDFESAVSLLDKLDLDGSAAVTPLTRMQAIAYAKALVQLDQSQRAIKLLDRYLMLGSRAQLAALLDLRNRVMAGEPVSFDTVTGSAEGIAEFFASFARELGANDDFETAMQFARLAEMIVPEKSLIAAEIGEYLLALDGNETALEEFRSIQPGDPLYVSAVIGEATALHQMGRPEEALELLEGKIGEFPDSLILRVAFADIYRNESRFVEAAAAYGDAIALIEAAADKAAEEEDQVLERHLRNYWQPIYFRGIAYERSDRWALAKEDLLRVIDVSNRNPFVLNYLGYSMVVQKEDLEEAESLIREALEQLPDNGPIIDSLGWVLYKKGRFEEALPLLERAVRLEPSEAEIIDHLGDVYWRLGRTRDAEFQWKRALSYENPYVEQDLIRRKLEVGLEIALEEFESEQESQAD